MYIVCTYCVYSLYSVYIDSSSSILVLFDLMCYRPISSISYKTLFCSPPTPYTPLRQFMDVDYLLTPSGVGSSDTYSAEDDVANQWDGDEEGGQGARGEPAELAKDEEKEVEDPFWS